MEKKLQRDTRNKVIGGVCAGLANYFGMDASLLRLLLALMILFAGSGFWLYIILWIVMPAGDPQMTMENGDAIMSDIIEPTKVNKGSLVIGLILIGLGALGLLHRFVPSFSWQMLWPVFLIVLGIILIIPKDKKS
ncbi:MAG: PspC domain-containing protein [Bacteroidales bacterium]|jgi:phage shock protein PspC (stress-responsive transcriptional regulator)|nr:PspC domain-containing protein [Bacteroidales bacterium]